MTAFRFSWTTTYIQEQIVVARSMQSAEALWTEAHPGYKWSGVMNLGEALVEEKF